MTIRICTLVAFAAMQAAGQAPQDHTKEFEYAWQGRAHASAPGDVFMWQAGTPGTPVTAEFIRTEMSYDGRTVRGAPYTAEALNETVQMLGDGNRITRKNTTQLARDSEGRTRRHEKISAIGPWASEAHEMIMINDPVAKMTYHLDPKQRTAFKMPLPEIHTGSTVGHTFIQRHNKEAGKVEEKEFNIAIAGAAVFHAEDEKAEPLGRRMVEGVLADGTRMTAVIPAGQIGNDRPIEVMTERWYSPELQVLVMSKRSDPRFGETTYRLTNIQRGEPLRSLFEIPPDYKVDDSPAQIRIMRKLAK